MIFENVPKIVGILYAAITLLLLAYLFYKDKFNKKIGTIILIISTAMGFLIFAPMFPIQLQLIILGDVAQLGAPITMALIGLVLFIILTFVFGRLFCGYICPIGAIQELLYLLPTPKKKITMKKELMIVRGIFLLIILIAAVFFSVNVLSYFGIESFFNLITTSLFSLVFILLLVISIFIYRPFCRIFCPYAVFLSLASRISYFKFRRNPQCIDCKKCENICPTNEAAREDKKQECYLCYRCKDICPVHGIDYSNNKGERS